MEKLQKSNNIEETLWDSASRLRGSVKSSEYKHVILSLILLKYANDRFEKLRNELVGEGKVVFADQAIFYNAKNVFYLEEISRWNNLMENAKQNDIAIKIDTALAKVEKDNPTLKGTIKSNDYAGLGLYSTKLAALLYEINNIDTLKDSQHDLIGRVYESFLGKFTIVKGKDKGEYYTPKGIVNLIAEIIEPYRGKIYNPCCGSGGMFVQSIRFIENHNGNKCDIPVYWQEYTNTTFKLAKMNLAIRGIASNIGEMAADTFHRDKHKELKADFIIANQPFNYKDWSADNELKDDPRWMGYETQLTSNANNVWILNIASKLSENGVAGFQLANRVLSSEDHELLIRMQLLKNNMIGAIVILTRNMFYSTDISVTLGILNKNKRARIVVLDGNFVQYRNSENEVQFVELHQWGEPYEKKYIQFLQNHIKDIAQNYHNWQREEFNKSYQNVYEHSYSATLEKIALKNYSLVPSKYLELVNRDEQVDFDKKMQGLLSELSEDCFKKLTDRCVLQVRLSNRIIYYATNNNSRKANCRTLLKK